MSECGRTFAGAKDARQNRLELIERIVVVARAVHAPCLTLPILAIVTVSTCNDVIVVAKSEPDVARIGLGVHAASALSTLAVTIAAIGIKARTHIEHAVVVEHQASSRLVIAQLDFGLNLVAMVTSDKHQGRRVTGQRALGGETDAVGNMFDALRLEGAVGFPFEADAELRQTTFRTLQTLQTLQTFFQRYRNGTNGVGAESLLVTDDGTEPSILSQLDGLKQSLTAQVGETVLVGVIDAIPTSVRRIDERTMSATPPAVRIGVVVNERIVGTVFPRSVDALRASHHHHMAGGRSCRAPFGI